LWTSTKRSPLPVTQGVAGSAGRPPSPCSLSCDARPRGVGYVRRARGAIAPRSRPDSAAAAHAATSALLVIARGATLSCATRRAKLEAAAIRARKREVAARDVVLSRDSPRAPRRGARHHCKSRVIAGSAQRARARGPHAHPRTSRCSTAAMSASPGQPSTSIDSLAMRASSQARCGARCECFASWACREWPARSTPVRGHLEPRSGLLADCRSWSLKTCSSRRLAPSAVVRFTFRA